MAIEKPTLGLSYNGFSPRGDYKALGQTFKQDRSFSNLAMASFASPIRVKGHPFVASLSYTQNWDEYDNGGFTTNIRIDPDIADKFDTVDQFITVLSDYYTHVNTVNIGFGTQIKQDLQFGFAANVYTGAGQGTYHLNVIRPVWPNPLDNGIQSVSEQYDSTRTDSATYSGINFTLGFKLVKPKFTAGLIVRTPFSLKQMVDQTDARQLTIQGLVFDDATQTAYHDNLLTKISMPLTIGAGVGYKLKENLLVGLDAEIRSFSDAKIKVRDSIVIIPGAKDEEYYTEYTTDFRNVFTVRGGAEYLWNTNTSIFPVVPLRVGAAYVPIPAPKYDASGSAQTASGMNFSLGTGAQWSQIKLDLAYQYQTLTREYANYGAKLEGKSHRFQLSFSGIF